MNTFEVTHHAAIDELPQSIPGLSGQTFGAVFEKQREMLEALKRFKGENNDPEYVQRIRLLEKEVAAMAEVLDESIRIGVDMYGSIISQLPSGIMASGSREERRFTLAEKLFIGFQKPATPEAREKAALERIKVFQTSTREALTQLSLGKALPDEKPDKSTAATVTSIARWAAENKTSQEAGREKSLSPESEQFEKEVQQSGNTIEEISPDRIGELAQEQPDTVRSMIKKIAASCRPESAAENLANAA